MKGISTNSHAGRMCDYISIMTMQKQLNKKMAPYSGTAAVLIYAFIYEVVVDLLTSPNLTFSVESKQVARSLLHFVRMFPSMLLNPMQNYTFHIFTPVSVQIFYFT